MTNKKGNCNSNCNSRSPSGMTSKKSNGNGLDRNYDEVRLRRQKRLEHLNFVPAVFFDALSVG
jgi:hypothetical protein